MKHEPENKGPQSWEEAMLLPLSLLEQLYKNSITTKVSYTTRFLLGLAGITAAAGLGIHFGTPHLEQFLTPAAQEGLIQTSDTISKIVTGGLGVLAGTAETRHLIKRRAYRKKYPQLFI